VTNAAPITEGSISRAAGARPRSRRFASVSTAPIGKQMLTWTPVPRSSSCEREQVGRRRALGRREHRGAIRATRDAADPGALAGDAADEALALRDEVRQHRLGGEEERADVAVEHVVEGGLVDRAHRPARPVADQVHQPVEVAMVRDHLGDRPLGLRLGAEVALDGRRAVRGRAALDADQFAVDQRRSRAGLTEGLCHGTGDRAAGAGDDDHLVAQRVHAATLARVLRDAGPRTRTMPKAPAGAGGDRGGWPRWPTLLGRGPSRS
jgi:hypothetical protein